MFRSVAGGRIDVGPVVALNLHAATIGAPENMGRATDTGLQTPPTLGLLMGGATPVSENTWITMPAGTVLCLKMGLLLPNQFYIRYNGVRTNLNADEIRVGEVVQSESNPVPVNGAKVRVSMNTANVLAGMGLIDPEEAHAIMSSPQPPTWAGAASNAAGSIKFGAVAVIVVALVVAGIWFVPRHLVTGG